MRNSFGYFNSSPEIIRLTVIPYIRYPLSLRQVEDTPFERGIDILYETVRLWQNRYGPMFAVGILKRWVHRQSHTNPRWLLGEVFVQINGEMFYLWRRGDYEGEVLETLASKQRDRKAEITFLKCTMKSHPPPSSIVPSV